MKNHTDDYDDIDGNLDDENDQKHTNIITFK